MVNYTAPDNAETQKRFSAKPLKIANIAFWAGIVLLAALFVWIFVATFMGGDAEEFFDSYNTYFLIPAALIFAFGLVFRITIKRNIKNAEKAPYVDSYAFDEDSFTIVTSRFGEVISQTKIYYADLVKIKDKKDFIALYPNAVTAHVIFKDGLTESELAEVRGYLKI